MFYGLSLFLLAAAFIVFLKRWHQISLIALLYFACLNLILAVLFTIESPFISCIRSFLDWSGAGLAGLIPFILLLLAYLMLSKIEEDNSLSGIRIAFNVFISLTLIGIVVYTAWSVIKGQGYMSLFSDVYSLVAQYLLINLLFFMIINLSLMCLPISLAQDQVLLVLGSRLKEDGQLSICLLNRLKKAKSLYLKLLNKNKKAQLILSGGQSRLGMEAEGIRMATYMLEEGIPQQDIRVEKLSQTTRENLINSKKIVAFLANGDQKVQTLIITSYFHLLRTYFYAWRYGYDLRIRGVTSRWVYGGMALLREFVAFFVLTKELNYCYIIGLLMYGLLTGD